MDDFEPVTDWEYQRLMQIFSDNVGKTFVQRILNPGAFPVLDQGDGKVATHRMAWGTMEGGKGVVYPTVMYDGKNLKDYGEQAWDHASRSGNYIVFDNPEEASWFSQKYKGAWAGQKNKPPR